MLWEPHGYWLSRHPPAAIPGFRRAFAPTARQQPLRHQPIRVPGDPIPGANCMINRVSAILGLPAGDGPVCMAISQARHGRGDPVIG